MKTREAVAGNDPRTNATTTVAEEGIRGEMQRGRIETKGTRGRSREADDEQEQLTSER